MISFLTFLPLAFILPYAVYDPVLQHVPGCGNVSWALRQTSGSPLMMASSGHAEVCKKWSFLQSWDDEYNFLASPPSHMSPLATPSDLSGVPSLLASFRSNLRLVRINVYEPLAWTVGKSMILNRLWRTKLLSDQPLGPVDFGEYSFRVRRQSLWLHCSNAALLYCLIFMLLCCSWDPKNAGNAPTMAAALSALVGSSIWSTHPAMAEVVGWPSANPYSLCAFFSLLCCVIHTYGRWYKRQHESTTGKGLREKALSAVVTLGVCSMYICATLSKR